MKALLLTTIKTIFWLLLLYYCVTLFIPKWQTLGLSQQLSTLSIKWLIAAGLLTFMHYLAVLGLWILLLQLLGARLTLGPIFHAYALALLPKYLPGGITAYGVRAYFTQQAGIPASIVLPSFVLEMGLTLGGAVTVSLLGFLIYPSVFLPYSQAWRTVGAGLGGGVCVGVYLLESRWNRWSKLPFPPHILLSLFGLYTGAWLIAGFSHWCLANAIVSQPGATFPLLVIASAFSWGLGFLSVIAPAGLGVREGALYSFVHNWMEEGHAFLFVTLSRLLMFGVEVILTGMGLLSSLFSRRP
jgi:hypothetical protein